MNCFVQKLLAFVYLLTTFILWSLKIITGWVSALFCAFPVPRDGVCRWFGQRAPVLGVGQLCSVRGCRAAPLATSPVWAPRGPGCAAGKVLLVRSRSEPFVLGGSRREEAAGDHAGENTAGADATHCCLLPGFWKGEISAGSACHGHSHPLSSPDGNKLPFIVYRGCPSLPAASIPTNSETRKQYGRILCL